MTSYYLDTSAWNQLLDHDDAWLIAQLRSADCLFSSCNLDEFCLSDDGRATSLAALGWDVSNQQKLLDHLELTTTEIRARQLGTPIDPFDHDDSGFFEAWACVRSNGVPPPLRQALGRELERSKRSYREHLRLTRDLFRPVFDGFTKVGIRNDWPAVLNEMKNDGSIANYLHAILEREGFLFLIPDPKAISSIDLVTIPCTACWLEYYIAASYLAAHETGKTATPGIGDQVDFRHACYAGLVDIFVTGDERMRYILSEMVVDRRASVIAIDQLNSPRTPEA